MNNLEIIDMKTLLSLAFLCIIFTGCEKDWKEEAPLNNIHLEERDIYDGLYENYGIKLSEKDSINYFEIFENNGDILLLGSRHKHAWMARFDSNGNEKYSTEITELPEGHKFSVFNSNSLIVINDSVLILCGWFVRADYYDGFFNLANGLLDQDIFTTFLSVFNFKNGREISRIDSVNGSALYSVSEWDNGYIIERNDDYRDNVSVKEKSILLDYSGNLLWNGDKSDLQAHIPKPDIPGPVDPIIPDSIIGNLQLGIMFVVDQSGAQRYLTVRFNTNIDKPVTITDLKVYDADGNIMVS